MTSRVWLDDQLIALKNYPVTSDLTLLEFVGNSFDPKKNDGLVLGLGVLLCTLLLELLSTSELRLILRKPGGWSLYLKAIFFNIFNNGVVGPIVYMAVALWFRQSTSYLSQIAMFMGVTVGHAIGYYITHRLMHTRRFYWTHRFHHRFNDHVVPVTANAVSVAEYFFAYMCPFWACSILLRPDRASIFCAVSLIAFNNLLIHTPFLKEVSKKVVPRVFVSTADHMRHHYEQNLLFAAPTINVDRILAWTISLVKKKD
eukprot:Selendium_serpulae@DN3967_c0_g1_i1.p1